MKIKFDDILCDDELKVVFSSLRFTNLRVYGAFHLDIKNGIRTSLNQERLEK